MSMAALLVSLWMSSSLATSVTPDHPRSDKTSITDMVLSTDWTEVLLRFTVSMTDHSTLPAECGPDLRRDGTLGQNYAGSLAIDRPEEHPRGGGLR